MRRNLITMTTSALLLLFALLASALALAAAAAATEVVPDGGMSCNSERTELSCVAANGSTADLLRLVPPPETAAFETIDLVFSGGQISIGEGFFASAVPALFSTQPGTPLEFRVKFQNFDALHLGPRAFSDVFPAPASEDDDKQPAASAQHRHMVVNVYNSKAAGTNVSSGVFDGLAVSGLTIHNADLSATTFEQLFRDARIGLLDLKGTYIQSDGGSFDGKVGRVVLIKQAASLDDNEFPKYPVNEYTLIAQNIRAIDGASLSDHDNVHELQIRSRNCTLAAGDLYLLRNLRRLVLAGVAVQRGAFDNLYNLESVRLDDGTRLGVEDVKQLANLPKINHLDYDPHLENMDDRERCELATTIATNPELRKNTRLRISSSRQPCTCEHKMFALLGNNKKNPCYVLQADCANSQCPVISQHFSGLAETTAGHHQSPLQTTHQTEQPAAATEETQQQQQQQQQQRFTRPTTTTEQRQESSDTSYTSSRDNNNLVTPHYIAANETSSKPKFNWLPLVVILSVVAALILVGVLVYLVRKRRDRNREFKPIPTNESSSAAAAAAAAKR